MRLSEDFTDIEGEDSGGDTPAADHRRELHSRVKSRSGDTCPQEFHVTNQNVQGLTGKDKLEKTIKLIIRRRIHRYCLQEKWLPGTFSRTIRGHLLLHHGMTMKPCPRGQSSSGVAIILGPALLPA